MTSQYPRSGRTARPTGMPPAYNEGTSKITIAIMGVSGSGKSSFINLASGTSRRKVSDGMEVQQQEVEVGAEFVLDGLSISLIDTPGTELFDASAIGLMNGMTRVCSEIQQRPQTSVHGVVYLHRIMNGPPFDFARKINIFKRLCGGNLKNLVIVTWSEGRQDTKLDGRLIDTVFQPAVAGGANIIHHYGTPPSAHDILRGICRNHSVTGVPASLGETAVATARVSRDVTSGERRPGLRDGERTSKNAHRSSGRGCFSILLCR